MSLGFGFDLIKHDELLGFMMVGVDGGDANLAALMTGGEFVRGDTIDIPTVDS